MDRLKSGAQQLGIHLSTEQIEQFEVYYRELIEWNGRMNLTAITGYEDAQTKHFLDSLTVITAIKQDDRGRALRVIDIGTGAGMPGIPLKIVLPDIRLTLLEATIKKTKFLEHITDCLGLRGVEIVGARAEEAGRDERYREKFDLALSRAVATLPALAELMLPFCAIGGRCIAHKKGNIVIEAAQARKAIEALGGVLSEIKRIETGELPDGRSLVVIDKTRPTPSGYPRRPGMPVKRPILD